MPHQVENKPETCAWCSGRGNESSDEKCSACRGVGSVLVPQPALKCPACHCTGRDDSYQRCQACKGTGWVMEPVSSVQPKEQDTKTLFEEFFENDKREK